MAYNEIPTIVTGDVATAAWGNTYLKDNQASGVPHLFTTDGDMVVATGSKAAKRLAAMGGGDTFLHEVGGLEADVSSGDGFVEIKSGSTTVIKSNPAASAAPTVNDDSGAGYSVSSEWIDLTNDIAYICVDASSGAAVWVGASFDIINDTTPQLGANLDIQAYKLVGNGGSTGIAISAAGEVTMAAQPAVAAYPSASILNVTGNATIYEIAWNTEIFDINADFATPTFTAPITGKYAVSLVVALDGLTAASTYGVARISAANNNPAEYKHLGVATNDGLTCNRLIDMDVNDTLTFKITVSGEASDVVDMMLANTPDLRTSFSIMLVG